LVSPPDDPLLTLFQEIWIEQRYTLDEPPLAAGQTVVDIGAHVGVFTVWAASQHPRVKVLAIEPSPRSFAFLQANVARNRLGNVTLVQCACGGGCGEAQLYSRGSSVADTLYRHDLLGSEFRPLSKTPVLGLDELFVSYNVGRCDFLKLDCEGAEYDILLNASEHTLRRIDRIALEYHQGLNEHTSGELVDFLKCCGLEVNRMPPRDKESGYMYAKRPNATVK
jgi:FkbM family methyltransferase